MDIADNEADSDADDNICDMSMDFLNHSVSDDEDVHDDDEAGLQGQSGAH